MRRRPAGWEPRGTVPPGARGAAELSPGQDETLDSLAGHWRIFQFRRGHRYSTDDVVTAWWAVESARADDARPSGLLDLGCGIGSVMLLILWRLQQLRAVGIEAQPASAELARRSIRYNGVDGRAEVRRADFRTPGVLREDEVFDLVSGSPPYLVAGEGRRSDHPQRGACRFEDRGGLADYLRVAVRHLAGHGTVTWVHATRHAPMALESAKCVGLSRVSWRRVVFVEGKESLVSVFSASRAEGDPVEGLPLVVRRSDGTWSDEYRLLRSEMGFPT